MVTDEMFNFLWNYNQQGKNDSSQEMVSDSEGNICQLELGAADLTCAVKRLIVDS